jgi:hypothetical protein
VQGSYGVGVGFGMGESGVRVAGITYSINDASGLYTMKNQSFIARIAIINGFYPFNVQNFTPTTDLSGASGAALDVLYDAMIEDSGPTFLTLWPSGIVSDDGQPVTLIMSKLVFPAGGIPAGMLPQAFLLLHADYYKGTAQRFSPGGQFES